MAYFVFSIQVLPVFAGSQEFDEWPVAAEELDRLTGACNIGIMIKPDAIMKTNIRDRRAGIIVA